MQNNEYDAQHILKELQNSYWEGVEDPEEVKSALQDLIYVLVIQFSQSCFAIELLKTKEVLKVPKITSVPRSPEELLGLINLRGRICPLYDIRKILSLPKIEITEATRLIMIHLEAQQVGILVDHILSIHELQKNDLQPPLVDDIKFKKQYILGKFYLNHNLVLLLDIEKLFQSQELTKVHLE
ncbi:MAG: chemotaxis protein CheW [Planctomycetota bacterium]